MPPDLHRRTAARIRHPPHPAVVNVGAAPSIGAPGFEPGTSPTRTVRATRLRHAPKTAISLAAAARPPGTLRRMWPREAIAFLEELEENNDRDWFKSNRARYDDHLVA